MWMPFTSSNKPLCWWDVYVISNPSVQSFAKENIASVVFQSSGRISTFQFKIKIRFFYSYFFLCLYVCMYVYLFKTRFYSIAQTALWVPRPQCYPPVVRSLSHLFRYACHIFLFLYRKITLAQNLTVSVPKVGKVNTFSEIKKIDTYILSKRKMCVF